MSVGLAHAPHGAPYWVTSGAPPRTKNWAVDGRNTEMAAPVVGLTENVMPAWSACGRAFIAPYRVQLPNALGQVDGVPSATNVFLTETATGPNAPLALVLNV